MEIPHHLAHEYALASASSRHPKSISMFVGSCRPCLPWKGARGASHLYTHFWLKTDHTKVPGLVKCWSADDFEGHQPDFDSSRVSRSGSSIIEYIEDQDRMEKSSYECCSGLKEAARYACNDAKIVNACAREGFILLTRGFQRLDERACQDVALLGSGFLKLDARARQDTVKLDTNARWNAAQLHNIALDLTDKAQVKLKIAADKHWNDGALDADLRLADLRAKRRAMEDAFMALQFVKSIHNGMVKTAYRRRNEFGTLSDLSQKGPMESKDPLHMDGSDAMKYDTLAALQNAYWDIASALAQADGIDYSDPEELELIVAALLDMNVVDSASSATMLSECTKSPNVATRRALANALGNAPSVWDLGNAGMGALQRLARDEDPAVAAAASKALEELEKQWRAGSPDLLIFHANSSLLESLYPTEDDSDGEM